MNENEILILLINMAIENGCSDTATKFEVLKYLYEKLSFCKYANIASIADADEILKE